MKQRAGGYSLKCHKQEGFTAYSSNAAKRRAPGADTRIIGRASINHKQERATGSPKINSQCAAAAWSRATSTREAGDTYVANILTL